MDDLSKEYVISFFNKSLMFHGDRPEAVRWTSPGQKLRYEALLKIGDLNGRKILDFGCGKGDLFSFLVERGMNVDYTGYDLNENLISLAKKKIPGARFRVFDIEQERLAEDFDYILLCGVFNLKVAGLEALIRRTLSRLFSHCRIGLGFNALSADAVNKDFELNYVSVDELCRFAADNLSPHVRLQQGPIPDEFMLYVYRDAFPV